MSNSQQAENIALAYEWGAKQFREPFTIEDSGIPLLVLPEGLQIQECEHLLSVPFRKTAFIKLIDVASFCTYVNTHKEPGTTLFASFQDSIVKAAIDYHIPGEGGQRWCVHTACLNCAKSVEWQKWLLNNGRWVNQVQLADHIEELSYTIAQPEASKLLEVAENLQVSSEMRFDSKINRYTGGVQLTYSEDVQDQSKSSIKIPNHLVIALSPYEFGIEQEIDVRLRFRITEGKIMFQYILDRPDQIIMSAFKNTTELVAKELDMPVLLCE